MTKKTLKILLVAVIVILTALPAVYDNSVFGYLPVLLLVLALLLSFICLLIVKKSIRITPVFSGNECRRGRDVRVGLRIMNRGPVLCPRAEMKICVSDQKGEKTAEKKTSLTLAPGSESKIGFQMNMPHIGVYDIETDDMQMHDFFGLFGCRMNSGKKYQVCVLPKIFPLDEMISTNTIRGEMPIERSLASPGASEYTGTREYAVGDSMKKIHWKLSAKSVNYLTKTFEGREMSFTVILDFTAEKQKSKETAMDLYDCIIETGMSLLDEISRVHTSYYLVYADQSGRIKRVTPKGREDDLSLIKDFSVLKENPGPDDPDACSILEEDNLTSSRSPNVILVTARVTENLLQQLLTVKRQGRTPELYIIVPEEISREEYQTLKKSLRPLGEADIYYDFVTAGTIGETA